MPWKTTKEPKVKFRAMRKTPSGVQIMYDSSGPPRRRGGAPGKEQTSWHDTSIRDACIQTDPVFRIKAAKETPKHWLPEKNPQGFVSFQNSFSATNRSLYHNETIISAQNGPNKNWLPIEWSEVRRPTVDERRADMNRRMEEMRMVQKIKKPRIGSIYEHRPKHNHCCPTTLYQQRLRRREALGLGLYDTDSYCR